MLCFSPFFFSFMFFTFIETLAEIPGIALDSVKSEGIREINYAIIF
jgi:hypothetical protein